MFRPLILMLALAALPCAAQDGEPRDPAADVSLAAVVVRLDFDDEPITPVTVRRVERALAEAEARRATCLLIVMDTPGGLVDATREIVKSMLASPTPTVVYVSPSGARAASAGLFITLVADVAAMAPGTHIGAAYPVQIGGLPIGPQQPEPDDGPQGTGGLEKKIVNDTAAWARSLAALHGRNADWAADAVREGIAAPAAEALAEGVVDLMAADVDELLSAIDGRQVERLGVTRTLHTAHATVFVVESWWGERILGALSNPNIAFLLLVFGFYGILFEIYSPGWGVAGTLGVVCMVLAFFGLSVLPVNSVGLLLIAVAFGLFIAEAFVTSYGALALGGAVCLLLGGLMLVDSPAGFMRVSLNVALPVAAATALIAMVLVGAIVRAHRHRVSTGVEGLVGRQARAVDDFHQEGDRWTGTVRIHGEFWSARVDGPVHKNQNVIIDAMDGLVLLGRTTHPDPAT